MNALTGRIIAAGPGRLAVALATYVAVLLVLRLSLFPGGSDDDAEILYYTQSWALAYKTGQPPLYAWLIRAAEEIMGPAMGAVVGVKYALLAAFYVFAYQAARRLFTDSLFAALAPLSLVACYFIGWETVVSYSHTVLLLAAMAAAFWLVLRLETRFGWLDYLWVALAVATGLLAKYNFILFLVPLLAAAWRHPGLRGRVFGLRFLAAMILAAGIAALPLVHFLTDADALAAAAGAGRLFPVVDDRLAAAGRGLGQFTLATLGLVSPFLPFALGMFPGALAPLPRPSARLINSGRFLETYLLVLVVVCVAAILVTGAADVRNNWVVVWFPLPLYLLLRIKVFTDADGAERRLHWFTAALLVVTLAVPAGLVGRGILGPQTCRKCNFFVPYEELARSLAVAGFSAGTIVAVDRPNQIAGNLRRYFPHARVISTRWRDYMPPLNAAGQAGEGGKCALIWSGGPSEGGEGRMLVEDLRGGIPVPKQTIFRRSTHPLPGNPDKRLSWSFVVLDGEGTCR
ncbi:glycosyltransferase family 39 protein [Thalassospiraceae bacterium LMO-SO8]|nr:glycosyltransferase family 39 protein [Alphaproteobacteria bacterium LMO-S08]WND76310.1 glycosyltransferase family 39 protein [Thalassospiraceae bacterium LMO-SO8]